MLKEKQALMNSSGTSIADIESDRKYDIKQWKAEKKSVEDALINSLTEHLQAKNTKQFQTILTEGVSDLNQLYARLPFQKNAISPEDSFRNKCLRQFFIELCSTEGNSEFITIFITILPLENEPLQQAKNQYPIHIALNGKAFSNAETLLKFPDLNVDAMWQKQTPLMMLFKMATDAIFETVKQLVVLLAEKGADINLGDYRAHPLSVLCKSTNLNSEQKRELLEFCRQNFVCDLDSSFEGQPRKDIEATFEDLKFDQNRSEITASTMKSFLLEGKSQEFVNEFDDFVVKSPEPSMIYELLQLAAIRNRMRCVQKILMTTSQSPNIFDPLPYKETLSKALKTVCAKGYPEVLKFFLDYIEPAEIYNERPLGLVCVRNLAKKITNELCECLDILLEDARIAFDKTDHENKGALEYAIEHDLGIVVRRIIGVDKHIQKKY